MEASTSLATQLRPAAARLRSWAINHALPLWAAEGFDRKNGRFEERLSFDKSRIEGVPHRLMVQARQIYSYALAAQRGWYRDAYTLVDAAYVSMVRDFLRRDGRAGWVFSVDRAGNVADSTRDLYAHAFVLLGIASYVHAGGARAALIHADDTLAFIDGNLAAGGGGYFDALPRPDKLRRQNPHMHLFEGLLALWDCSGERRYLDRAVRLFDLFATRFFEPASGVLGEYFDDQLLAADGVAGDIVEPGHHYEWVWLLRRFEQASGLSVQYYADALYRHADRYGYDQDGLIMDELLRNGMPHRRSRRAWPITEAIKGNLAEAANGRDGAVRRVIALADRLHSRFLTQHPPGGWIDRLDESGRPAADFMPASTLYHILCALDELDRFAEGR